jgi:hypothetical protein
MPYKLHIPGERPRTLRWNVKHPLSSHGQGVLLYGKSNDALDGAAFRLLRDMHGAWIETDRPDRARSALALFENESLGEEK